MFALEWVKMLVCGAGPKPWLALCYVVVKLSCLGWCDFPAVCPNPHTYELCSNLLLLLFLSSSEVLSSVKFKKPNIQEYSGIFRNL